MIFFDSLVQMPEDYAFGFEKILNKKYLKNVVQLKQSTSNMCGVYCAYYVVNRYAGKTMKDILKDFNPNLKRNDRFLVSKMRQSGGARKRNDAYSHQGNVKSVLLGNFKG